MPITLTAPPAVVEGARSYAEHSGMTLEAFVLAYLESAAKNEQPQESKDDKINKLKAELDAAVKEQNFEHAAELRDRIKEMEAQS